MKGVDRNSACVAGSLEPLPAVRNPRSTRPGPCARRSVARGGALLGSGLALALLGILVLRSGPRTLGVGALA